jgi:hypothetical protein
MSYQPIDNYGIIGMRTVAWWERTDLLTGTVHQTLIHPTSLALTRGVFTAETTGGHAGESCTNSASQAGLDV